MSALECHPLSLLPPLRADVLNPLWTYALENPGKELRARVLVAAEEVSRQGYGEVDQRVAIAVAATQLTHLATLAHDDIIDGSDLRRGQPSLPARFGAPLAGAGGATFVGRALTLFALCGEEAVRIATEAATQMCEGQMLEMRSRFNVDRTVAEYMNAVARKTGAPFRMAALLGASFGRAADDVCTALADYGGALGTAHQIIDDILDLAANGSAYGKPAGTDLRNGNVTLPVIYAVEEHAELRSLLRAGEINCAVVEEVRNTRGIERARLKATQLLEEAKRAIGGCPNNESLCRIADEDLRTLDVL